MCCSVPGRQLLWGGDTFCIQLPGLLWGASAGTLFLLPWLGQLQCLRGCWFQERHAVPLPGRFTGSCRYSFACRMLGRASLPPLHRQIPLIPVAAVAAGRLQEVQHPSLCHLVWLPCTEVLVAPGLLLVLGVSLLSGSQRCWGSIWCWGTKREQTFTALKTSSTSGLQCRREGSDLGSAWAVCVAVVAARLVAQWCVAAWRGASRGSAFRGPLHPAGGHCSSSRCSPGTRQLFPQELFGFAGEITVLGKPPCHGTGSVCYL